MELRREGGRAGGKVFEGGLLLLLSLVLIGSAVNPMAFVSSPS